MNEPDTPGQVPHADEELEGEELQRQEAEVRSLLRAARAHPVLPKGGLLQGVQRKIRQRSRGKFYADGWSTGQWSFSTYVLSCLLMLAILGFVWVTLGTKVVTAP